MSAFEYLEQYKSFDTVEEMDSHVEQHIQQHFFNLTESERAIVFALASRSLMYPGASHLKAETIADQAGVSTKTVYRAVKKLVELGIIEKIPGTKMNGIKGANIYKILPFKENVLSKVSERVEVQKPCESKVEVDNSEKQPLNSFNQSFKNNNTYATQSFVNENDIVDNLLITKEQTPYEKLKEFVDYFINDKKFAYKCYGIFLAQTAKQFNKPNIDIAIEALKHTFKAVKSKTVHSITGYFNNTLKGLLDKYYEDLASECYADKEEIEFVNGENTRGPEWLYW